jgi:hypothetical protein
MELTTSVLHALERIDTIQSSLYKCHTIMEGVYQWIIKGDHAGDNITLFNEASPVIHLTNIRDALNTLYAASITALDTSNVDHIKVFEKFIAVMLMTEQVELRRSAFIEILKNKIPYNMKYQL